MIDMHTHHHWVVLLILIAVIGGGGIVLAVQAFSNQMLRRGYPEQPLFR